MNEVTSFVTEDEEHALLQVDEAPFAMFETEAAAERFVEQHDQLGLDDETSIMYPLPFYVAGDGTLSPEQYSERLPGPSDISELNDE